MRDTSRQGRYHNHRYAQLAREVGLHAQATREQGFALTTLTPAAAKTYRGQIAALRAAITLTRAPEPTAGSARRPGGLRAATCRCPRRIRIAPSVLGAGAITCANCHAPFTLTATSDSAPTHRDAATGRSPDANKDTR